jgi:hypothetical protein
MSLKSEREVSEIPISKHIVLQPFTELNFIQLQLQRDLLLSI